jgi:exodeoxyribonuclease VII large subunit
MIDLEAPQTLEVPTSMLDPSSLAKAISDADADILVVIRGGGDSDQFRVFDDQRVLKALAGNKAYRITGLGHTGNRTLADLIVDHAARAGASRGPRTGTI